MSSPIDMATTLIHAFIISHIDYCNSLLYGAAETLTHAQSVQNAAAHLIT